MRWVASWASSPYREGPGEHDQVVIKRSISPKWADADLSKRREDALEVTGRGVVGGGGFHPEGQLREEVAEHGDFKPPRRITQTGADNELTAGGDARGGEDEQFFLLGGGEKLKNIEDAHIAMMRRKAGADIAVGEGDVWSARLGDDLGGRLNLPRVIVEAMDGDGETLGPQEKREESKPAPEIQQG